MKDFHPLRMAGAVFLTAIQATWGANAPVILDAGHNPLEVLYENDAWTFFIDGSETGLGRLNPDEAVYHLTDATQLTIPNNPNFAFLGEPGAPVWIAPHIESPGVLLLGISGERMAPNLFLNDRLNLRLVSVEGPGSFTIYGIDSSGDVQLLQDSGDGIDGQDTVPFGIGGHDHQNWSFNAPGIYEITFQAAGTLQNGQQVVSPEATFHFAVGDVSPNPPCDPVLVDEGDADVAVVWENETLRMEVFWGARDQAYPVEEAHFLVKPNSRLNVSTDPAFAFLGSPGEQAWVAPQAEVPGKLFLALAGDNLPSDVFVDDLIRVTMKAFEGPGNFSVYETNPFGSPTLYFNTENGVSDDDARDLITGEHYHMNWAFTQAGAYSVAFEATGVLKGSSQTVVSEITHFHFQVVENESPGVSLTSRQIAPDRMAIEFHAADQVRYQLQSRAMVASGEWTNVGTSILGTNERHSAEVPIDPSATARFYRVFKL